MNFTSLFVTTRLVYWIVCILCNWSNIKFYKNNDSIFIDNKLGEDFSTYHLQHFGYTKIFDINDQHKNLYTRKRPYNENIFSKKLNLYIYSEKDFFVEMM